MPSSRGIMVMELRDFIRADLRIEREVSLEYEASRILHENQDKTVLFERCGRSGLKVIGNVCPSRERLCEVLGTNREGYIARVLHAIENPLVPITVEDGKCYEVEKDFNALPILKHFKGDAGRYITAGIVIAKDLKYGRNISVHRLQVLDGKRLAIRLVERHLYLYYKRAEEAGKPLEVAIAIGVHPIVLYSASYSVPIGYDEFRLASALLGKPLELAKCKTVDLEVPSSAEIVIEGRILPNERVEEGPFADITGTYDIARQQPVVEITHVSHRRNAIYHALLPSSKEHMIFMGMPREPGIYAGVAKVAKARNVCLTEGGASWLHGVVAIEKQGEEDARKAIAAAFEAHPSMKHVVIVDDDIDIFDPNDVELALATRFQADRDIIMLKNVKGSSLDPSAHNGLTTKVGLDATKPLDKKGTFERASIL